MNTNAAWLRDMAQIMVDNQRPNSSFWKDPRAGQSEYGVNEFLTLLVLKTEQKPQAPKTREEVLRDLDAMLAATGD